MASSAIAALKRLGRPSLEGRDWYDYRSLGLGMDDIPMLAEIAAQKSYDDESLDEEEGYASIHAWRALGQLGDVSAIPPLLTLVDAKSDCDWLFEDLPRVLSSFGEAALAAIARKLQEPNLDCYGGGAVAESLVLLAQQKPELREPCVDALAAPLQAFTHNEPMLNAMLIHLLVELKAVERAPLMEAAFAADAVDWSYAGDWEAVQVALGLLEARRTPKPNYFAWRLEEALESENEDFRDDERRYRLRIELEGIEPPIWRSIEISSWTSLAELHLLIQAVMPWENAHLYQFIDSQGRRYEPESAQARLVSLAEDIFDDDKTSLKQVLGNPGDKLLYWYDFGDDWRHVLTLESVDEYEVDDLGGARCLDGARACPPEDCGGPWGYKDKLEILADPEHEEHEVIREWFGGDFDPEAFDREDAEEGLLLALENSDLGLPGWDEPASRPKANKAKKKAKRKQEKKARKAQRKRKK